jgi:hypothetical protein
VLVGVERMQGSIRMYFVTRQVAKDYLRVEHPSPCRRKRLSRASSANQNTYRAIFVRSHR